MQYFGSCPLCGGEIDFLTVTAMKDERVYSCRDCGVAFLNPRMDSVEHFYEHGDFNEEIRGSINPSKIANDTSKAARRWAIIKPLLPQKENIKLLEIGCSWGAFLHMAAESCEVTGIEPKIPTALKNTNIIEGFFPQCLNDDDKYDVIVVLHVLEHVENPKDFLSQIRHHLTPDGIFFLEYPDLFFATRRSQFQIEYFQKSHLFDFNIATITWLLGSCGFGVYDAYTYPDYPMDKNILLACQVSEPENEKTNLENITREYAALARRLSRKRTAHQSRPLRVLHIASHFINVGDGAIIQGIRRGMSTIHERGIEFNNLDIVDIEPNVRISSEAIDGGEYDLVIVGGGGTIDGHVIHADFGGMALHLTAEELEKLKTPICFVGLGHNLFRDQEFYGAEKLQEFVNVCEKKGIPFSVRADGSLDRLSKIIDTRYIEQIPDPGLFVGVDNSYAPSWLGEKPFILCQWAGDAVEARGGAAELAEFFTQLTIDIIDREMDVAFAMHTHADVGAVTSLKIRGEKYRKSIHITEIGTPQNAHRFFKGYALSAGVVGTRGHSIICPVGLRIPTVAISTHDKVSGFMDYMGLPYQNELDPQKALATLLGEKQVISEARLNSEFEIFCNFLSKCVERIH